MKKIVFTLILGLCGAVFAVSAKDIKKVEFTVEPPMHCEKCEAKIKNRLKFERGVKKIDPNAKRGTVVVEYDAEKISAEKLAKSLEKAGYKATEKKAE